ncbi:hypothetical protein BU24DRAFT_146441 [Aaosphaeria arxii CBS 175.79]|uniref:BZIP domain-containing protein n=1 Tax=Aaosphaeria arxii CBS 175.79 TaxID=1450172 RepID=A0A6A5XVJ1_9PLEO|nr:uncharacterized protein BU24DRAFT_146441 [Aaosphaeria arxii CBS 175.79]KAF2017232.1 hypothetical protein BU24DRAFT_146441 [Aaosphaeria arxii CBS 175.79]
MADSKNCSSDSKDKNDAAYLKRREQVRRAQRTHRERKEAYIKTLENEVLQLRTNETRIVREGSALQAEVERLRSLLDQQYITSRSRVDSATSEPRLGGLGHESSSSCSSPRERLPERFLDSHFEGSIPISRGDRISPEYNGSCSIPELRYPRRPSPIHRDGLISRPGSSASEWDQVPASSSYRTSTSSVPSIELSEIDFALEAPLR